MQVLVKSMVGFDLKRCNLGHLGTVWVRTYECPEKSMFFLPAWKEHLGILPF